MYMYNYKQKLKDGQNLDPWTVACQAPLSMGFSRQEHWRGLPCPPPGDLPPQESNPSLSHCRQILYHLTYQGSLEVYNYKQELRDGQNLVGNS